jgi:hypothetical protein
MIMASDNSYGRPGCHPAPRGAWDRRRVRLAYAAVAMASNNDAVPAVSSVRCWTPAVPPAPAATPPDGVWAVCPGDCPPMLPGADVEPEVLVEPEALELELFAVEPFAVDPLQVMVTRPLPPLMVPVLTPAVRVGEVTDAAA